MDYYSTLGLKRGATDAEIKKAYRSMAMKHHPDRGGDEKKFKEISTAYDVLSDPQKKQMVDMGMDPNQQGGGFNPHSGPYEFHFNSGNFGDMFGNFGFGPGPFTRRPQNRTLSINVEVTLEEVLTGRELNAEVGMPGGKKKIVNISIPQGIDNGQQIRYTQMGDDSIPNVPPGDLIVNIFVKNHPRFKRDGDMLVTEATLSVWEAMLGTSVDIKTLDDKTLSITIPAGTQPETVLSCRGEGLPNMRSRQRGNLLIKVKVTVPRHLTDEQKTKIQELSNDI